MKRILKRILLVEPHDDTRGMLEAAAAPLAEVESHGSFEAARKCLLHAPFDFLVTNIRLGAYNGLHLVYLGRRSEGAPRPIVYSDERDTALAREIQRAGAFYEVGARLPVTLAAFLMGKLPGHDRRDPARVDRRTRLGGGRRCWDLAPHPYTAIDRGFDEVPGLHPSSM